MDQGDDGPDDELEDAFFDSQSPDLKTGPFLTVPEISYGQHLTKKQHPQVS